MASMEVKGEERIKVIQRYIQNPNMDDSDLYYSGLLCDNSSTFSDPTLSHIANLASFLLAQRRTPKEVEEDTRKKSSSLVMREKASYLAFPALNIPKAKRSPRKKAGNPVFQKLRVIPGRFKKPHFNKKDAFLVIKKALYETDVTPNNGRLSIPLKKVNRGFLTKDEDEILSNGRARLEARLIEPSGEECKIKLARWNMHTSFTYNLLKPWNDVVARNKLRKGTVVELYSFREADQLCFALLKVGNT